MDRRTRGLTVATYRAALAAVILVLIVGAYYPFAWDPPRTVHNQATRVPGGALRFGEMNDARTPGTPAWLAEARNSGSIQIRLDVEPGSAQQRAPMMMLASDSWHADFAILQARSRLAVWLLRPGSDAGGGPPFGVRGVLNAHQWTRVDVILNGDVIRIIVDGRTQRTKRLPPGTLRTWGPGEVALGGAVHGGFAWHGEIRQAEVLTGSYAVNYISPGALSVPRSYLYLPDHIEPFPPTDTGQWLLALVDLLTFIPVGFLIVWSRRPPINPAFATVFAGVLAVLLAAGKFLFHDRHTSLANVAGQVIGALLGALVAWHLARTQRGAAWLRGWDPGRKKTVA